MGNVKKIIADEVLPNREYYNDKLWCDLCENLHIHLRNIRLEFSFEEWKELVVHLFSVKNELTKYPDYKEDAGYQMLLYTPTKAIEKDSKYFPNRFRIEEEHDGSVHIHYRDIRLQVTKQEYNQIAKAMIQIN